MHVCHFVCPWYKQNRVETINVLFTTANNRKCTAWNSMRQLTKKVFHSTNSPILLLCLEDDSDYDSFTLLIYSQTPSVLSAVRVHATCRVSIMTWTVSRSTFCRNTVMTTPISRSRLIWIFLYSVISPCCPEWAISAADTGHEGNRDVHLLETNNCCQRKSARIKFYLCRCVTYTTAQSVGSLKNVFVTHINIDVFINNIYNVFLINLTKNALLSNTRTFLGDHIFLNSSVQC